MWSMPMLKRTDSCPSSAQPGREKAAYTEQMRWGSVLTINHKQRRHAMDNLKETSYDYRRYACCAYWDCCCSRWRSNRRKIHEIKDTY